MQKILIDDELHREVKAAAALLGMSIRRYTENALRVMTDADLGDPETARETVGKAKRRKRERREEQRSA